MMPRPADRASAVESGVISSPLTTDYLAGRVRAEGCEPAAGPRASTRSEGRPASPAPRGPPLGGWSPWPDAAAGARNYRPVPALAEGPTFSASHALSGRVARRKPVTRSRAAAVSSQLSTGHSFQATIAL